MDFLEFLVHILQENHWVLLKFRYLDFGHLSLTPSNDHHFTTKKYVKFGPKSQSTTKNRMCLEQQIYASPENFTPTLLVMLDTFRRSD